MPAIHHPLSLRHERGEPVVTKYVSEDWGFARLLSKTDEGILWTIKVQHPGTAFPICRSHTLKNLLSITTGCVKVQEFAPGHNGRNCDREQLLLDGDAYQISPMRWHRLLIVQVTTMLLLQSPTDYRMKACLGDIEEWKPQQFIGRG